MELTLAQDVMAQAHAKKKLAVGAGAGAGVGVGVTDERAHVIFDGVHMRIPDYPPSSHPLTGDRTPSHGPVYLTLLPLYLLTLLPPTPYISLPSLPPPLTSPPGASSSLLQAGFGEGFGLEHAIGTGAGGISTALRGVDYSLEYRGMGSADALGQGLGSQVGLGSSISIKMPQSMSLQVATPLD